MEIEAENKRSKLRQARRKVAELKGFYMHLMVYLTINTMLTLIKIVGYTHNSEAFMGPLWHFSTYATWLFWGIGLAFHAMRVFSFNPLFGKDWEERKIKEFMNDPENERRWK